MEVTLNWKNKMAFQGAADSGFQQTMDSDESVGGENSAARPMEFIALGLAGCTAMDVISILQKKKQVISDFQVKVHVERANEHPKVFTNAVIEYLVTGKNVSEESVLRAIQLSADKYCPAQAMLSKAFPIKLIYTIFDKNSVQTHAGEYIQK
ncbi:MAG: OsmC family protein [Anaerolineales bacterium]|nr:OsmC family protein [Anaerolineales bacterium]